MRIGILTFHKAINYGAYLQAFSLSQKLQKQFPGHQIEIVDYIAPKEQARKLYTFLWNIKHHGIKGGLSELKRFSIFQTVQKCLPLSPQSFCTKNLQKLFSYIEERYDLLIIGSDAVFNWNQTKFPSAFIPEYPFSIPVCTYAASVHGLRFYSASPEQLHRCGKAFSRMAFVGVRDNCTEVFVKHCAPDAATIHCCDPTLFIDREEIYRKGCSAKETILKKHGISLDDPYIVVMIPDSNLVQDIQRRYGKEYKILSVFTRSSYADHHIADIDPFEWTVVLRQAALVVTSYFHGTLLSLVQGTPVLVFDHSGYCDGQYEGKLKDLMVTRLGLPELYYDQTEAYSLIGDPAFYTKTDSLLAGKYANRICQAVENERETATRFMNLLATELSE